VLADSNADLGSARLRGRSARLERLAHSLSEVVDLLLEPMLSGHSKPPVCKPLSRNEDAVRQRDGRAQGV
jgi:hypothetical protein